MRTYIGSRTADRIIVMVRDDSGKARMLDPAATFNWGYGGDGAEALALAILIDHIGETPLDKRVYRETAPSTALRCYQQFKFDFIQDLPDRWELKSEDIEGWLRMKYNNAEAKKRDYAHEPQFPKELGGNIPGGTIITG